MLNAWGPDPPPPQVSEENLAEILDTLRQNEMDPMTFLDYLAYIPLFCDLHEQALAAPLHT